MDKIKPRHPEKVKSINPKKKPNGLDLNCQIVRNFLTKTVVNQNNLVQFAKANCPNITSVGVKDMPHL